MNKAVTPAEAGVQVLKKSLRTRLTAWIPAFAGMTFFFIAPLFAEPHAYPVPCVVKERAYITFNELPGAGEIKIFTVSGEEVISLPVGSGELQRDWYLTNSSGEKVATGVYLFIIDCAGQKTNGKLVVIR